MNSAFSALLGSVLLSCFGCVVMIDKKRDKAGEEAPELLKAASPLFDFNVLAFETVDLRSSAIQGRLAARGDVELSDYSIGGILKEDGNRCDLSVGGKLTFMNGSVTRGLVCVRGSIHTEAVGTKFPGSSVVAEDFEKLKLDATTLTSTLAGLSADVTLDDKYLNGGRGQLVLTGSDPELNVFELSATLLSAASGIEVRLPKGASAVFNIHGGEINLVDFSLVPKGSGEERVLFNFPDATALTLSRANFLGSILAPEAEMRFDEGTANGSIVVRSASGDGRFNLKPYAGVLAKTASNP